MQNGIETDLNRNIPLNRFPTIDLNLILFEDDTLPDHYQTIFVNFHIISHVQQYILETKRFQQILSLFINVTPLQYS